MLVKKKKKCIDIIWIIITRFLLDLRVYNLLGLGSFFNSVCVPSI